MPIASTINRVTYQGNGSSALFPFQYEFHALADLDVYIWNSARIVATSAKTLNVEYSVSGTADAQGRYTNGANVIFNSTPATGDYIIITRDMAGTQGFSLGFNQVIPNAELIKSLDRLALVELRLSDLTSRSMTLKDSFPLTFDPSLPDRLPAGAPLVIGSSGVNIQVGVVSVQGSSAATFFGVLPTNNGGTGLDFSLVEGILYSPGTNGPFSNIGSAASGYLLTANGSSKPSFQAFSVANINSGVLAVAFGGTGTPTALTPKGVMVASSATQMFSTPAGGNDQPFIGNNGGVPSFQPLNLVSNSSVTGIMAQSHGGTGSASSFPQYGVIYQQDTNVYGFIPSAADGRALVAHGSSAPSFDVFTGSPNPALNTTANTVITNTTDVVILSSSNYNVILYSAVGQTGRKIRIIKDSNTFDRPITIIGTSAQLLGQNTAIQSSSFPLYTQDEMVEFQARGTGWDLIGRKTDTDWIGFSSVTASSLFTALTTGPGYGAVITNTGRGKRKGTYYDFEWQYRASTAGVTGTGQYFMQLSAWGAGLVIDSAIAPVNSGIAFINSIEATVGSINLSVGATGGSTGTVVVYGTTHLKFQLFAFGTTPAISLGYWGSAIHDFNSATMWVSIKGSVPILGWRP